MKVNKRDVKNPRKRRGACRTAAVAAAGVSLAGWCGEWRSSARPSLRAWTRNGVAVTLPAHRTAWARRVRSAARLQRILQRMRACRLLHLRQQGYIKKGRGKLRYSIGTHTHIMASAW